MSPRILIVSAGLLHGGHDPRTIRARRLIDGLGRRGFEIDLLSLWLGTEPPPAVPGVRRVHAVAAPIDWEGDSDREPVNAEGLGEWVERAHAAITSLPPQERPELVYAIGVPVSALAAGAAVADELTLPLILDLGDPWPAPSAAAREHRGRVLGSGAALITTTPELAAQLRPLLAAGATTLLAPGGGEIRQRVPRPAGAPPLFVHLGAINAGRVDPTPAFSALAALHRSGRIEFRSHSNGWHPDLDQLPHPHLPMLPHAAALDLLTEATAALVLGNDNHEQLPSKVFEIACTETWALCISELEGDAAVEVLRETGHAVTAEANDEAAVTAAIERILEHEARGERPAQAPRYSWDRRLDRIADLLTQQLG